MRHMQLIDEAPVITEPLSILEAKLYSGIDEDYALNDEDIAGMIVSARKRMEAFLNVGLVRREVLLQCSGYSEIKLPLSPTGEILSVKVNGSIAPEDFYSVNSFRNKSVILGGGSYSSSNFFYNQNGDVEYTAYKNDSGGFWEINYTTGYVTIPEDIKLALKVEVDYLIKLMGVPDNDTMSYSALLLCKHYSQNPIL